MRIAELRKERGWSQAKLGARADVDPSTVNQIERGARRPNSSTLEKFAVALEVEVRDLYPKAQEPLPYEEDRRRLEGTPKALEQYMRRRVGQHDQAVRDPNSPHFKTPEAASLWVEMVSDEADDWLEWTTEHQESLSVRSEGWLDLKGWTNTFMLIGHAKLSFGMLIRKAQSRIEAMEEQPDQVARKRLEKVEIASAERQRRVDEAEKTANAS